MYFTKIELYFAFKSGWVKNIGKEIGDYDEELTSESDNEDYVLSQEEEQLREEQEKEGEEVSYQLFQEFSEKYGKQFEGFMDEMIRDIKELDVEENYYGDGGVVGVCDYGIEETKKWIEIMITYGSSSQVCDYYSIGRLPQIIKIYEQKLREVELEKLKLSEERRNEVVKQSLGLQYNYENSLWNELFNQYSHHNELYGQLLFHVALGTLVDIKINMGNRRITIRPHLFFMQDSRSGKNRGMEFVESVLSELFKMSNVDEKVVENVRMMIAKIDNQSDGTMLNRPVMRSRKGILEIEKDEETGEVKVIRGLAEKVHLTWYEEASFLLNPHNKYALEASQMYLTFLEGRPYYKELVQWSGYRSETFGDFCMVCLTRPIDNIKLHIIYSGLLLRMIFLPRILTPELRRIMDKADSFIGYMTNEEQEKYQGNFGLLIKNLKEIQTKVLKYPVRIRTELVDTFRVELDNKKNYLHVIIENSHLRFEHKKILYSFLAGYSQYFYFFSFQSAIMRSDSVVKDVINVELGDLEYAYNLIKATFMYQVRWIEDYVIVMETEETKWEYRKEILLRLKSQSKIPIKDVRRYLCKEGKMTQPTAGKTLEYFVKKPNNIIEIIDKYVVFK